MKATHVFAKALRLSQAPFSRSSNVLSSYRKMITRLTTIKRAKRDNITRRKTLMTQLCRHLLKHLSQQLAQILLRKNHIKFHEEN